MRKLALWMILAALPVFAEARCVESDTVCATILETQTFLLDQGYDVGVVDGRAGPKTCAGLYRFLDDAGLQIPATISQQNLSILLENNSVKAPMPRLADPLIWGIQRNLLLLGYDAGTLDGRMGSRTVSAVRHYQSRAGLPVTGKVTQELMDHLAFSTPKVYARARCGQ